ncbi:hypothetical protein ACU686_13005 [Yinghuangia aomiensis]
MSTWVVFDPFDLTDIEVRHRGRAMGTAIAHDIGLHTHPKAGPEYPAQPPARRVSTTCGRSTRSTASASLPASTTPSSWTAPTTVATAGTPGACERDPCHPSALAAWTAAGGWRR